MMYQIEDFFRGAEYERRGQRGGIPLPLVKWRHLLRQIGADLPAAYRLGVNPLPAVRRRLEETTSIKWEVCFGQNRDGWHTKITRPGVWRPSPWTAMMPDDAASSGYRFRHMYIVPVGDGNAVFFRSKD